MNGCSEFWATKFVSFQPVFSSDKELKGFAHIVCVWTLCFQAEFVNSLLCALYMKSHWAAFQPAGIGVPWNMWWKPQIPSFSENYSSVLHSKMEFINSPNEIKALLDYLSAPLSLSRVLLFLWLWNEKKKSLSKLDILNSLENMTVLSKIS